MKKVIKVTIATKNSKNLSKGDLVKHERGCIGKVIDVEYNDADEATIEWLDECSGQMSQRVSQIYINKIKI